MEQKLRIEKSKYPTEKVTHVLWLESQTSKGTNYRGLFQGTHKECLKEKERLEKGCKNVPKSKFTGFKLLRRAFHNR